MPKFVAQIQRHGFCVVPHLIDDTQINALKTELEHCEIARVERDGQTYGARNLLHLTQVCKIAAEPQIVSCLSPLLGPAFRMVRGLFFDKTVRANWPVAWHQDLSLAVQKRRDLPGWSNWTLKQGVTHVQSPPSVLDRMIAMRLHLDDCPVDNGALRLIPGSHRHGLLSRSAIHAMTSGAVETVTARAGDALFMRPLILHASSPSAAPHHRRVLHLEFAPTDLLPTELDWSGA